MVFGRWVSLRFGPSRFAPTSLVGGSGLLCAPLAATIATWNPVRTRCARSPPREPRGPSVWPWVSNRAHAPRGSARPPAPGRRPMRPAESIASALAVRRPPATSVMDIYEPPLAAMLSMYGARRHHHSAAAFGGFGLRWMFAGIRPARVGAAVSATDTAARSVRSVKSVISYCSRSFLAFYQLWWDARGDCG